MARAEALVGMGFEVEDVSWYNSGFQLDLFWTIFNNKKAEEKITPEEKPRVKQEYVQMLRGREFGVFSLVFPAFTIPHF